MFLFFFYLQKIFSMIAYYIYLIMDFTEFNERSHPRWYETIIFILNWFNDVTGDVEKRVIKVTDKTCMIRITSL
jgi:hypothetical protein